MIQQMRLHDVALVLQYCTVRRTVAAEVPRSVSGCRISGMSFRTAANVWRTRRWRQSGTRLCAMTKKGASSGLWDIARTVTLQVRDGGKWV